ncbi:contractile injection system protein, VgrG/Pvc8 family [Pseudomonas koreensis]|uniref:type VI secretion system Vgr family protein n=1 Tax=Pseudomonas koreensis TaxID=198620 RepID=UPI0021C7AFC2|nr:contractile injection system protein, VgrG/Pvc8 family [Pseudomonas koreensis]MCU0071874.1 contractile injection system protein, VgrG/Pvc8 family [Pseudomonas koreensis]
MFDPAHEPSFRLDVAGLSAPFEVLAFTGFEAISEPFAFEIDLLVNDPHLDLAGLMYRPARLCFGPSGNGVHGQLHSLAQHEHALGPRLCRARLGPQLSCLGLRYSQRIFSDRTVPQILDQVLREHGISASRRRFELQADHPSRTFCTQYGESDLQLVQRLCAQARIHFHFEHGARGHCLVFGDDPARLPRAGVLRFDGEGRGSPLTVRRWQISEHAHRGGTRLQCIRTAQGECDQATLRSGQWLALFGHPIAHANTRWLLTRIEHRADPLLDPPYSNRIFAVDHLPVVPVSTEGLRSRMRSPQRAWVVSVEEQQPDPARAVAVQFDWLYQGEGASPSHCWLPLAPALADVPSALLQEGLEVVVSFLEGDPEQPVISGVLQAPAVEACIEEEERLSLPDHLASEGLSHWLKAAEPLLLLCLIPGGGSYKHCAASMCSCRVVAGLKTSEGR